MKRIAVLGGGLGSLAAVYELTDPVHNPDWKKHYAITVYQMGWRLGGKCATGRAVLPERRCRIEEHGLHMWFGFYENAFGMLRRAYKEWKRPAGYPFPDADSAFSPVEDVTLFEDIDDVWKPWSFHFPIKDSIPGEGKTFDYDPIGYLRDLLEWSDDTLGFLGGTEGTLREYVRRARTIAQTPTPWEPETADAIVEQLSPYQRALLQLAPPASDEQRRMRLQLELAATVGLGLLIDWVWLFGLDQIEHRNFRDWLKQHGASQAALDSALIRGLHDLVFAYRFGDTTRPWLAAGTALRGAMRIGFKYKGAILYHMRAGMGETVITPLYRVLQQRGVEFRFFHRVDRLQGSSAGEITDIHVSRQATPKAVYHPIVVHQGLECWPSSPLYDQLVEGDKLRRHEEEHPGDDLECYHSTWEPVEGMTLKKGIDFDLVVLGIPVGALRSIAAPLAALSDRWKLMLERMETVMTQSLQLWLKPDADGLGWPQDQPPAVCAFAQPLNTYVDLTHVARFECWGKDHMPGHVAYLCGPMQSFDLPSEPTPDFPAHVHLEVRNQAMAWLEKNHGAIWPHTAGRFDYDLLVDPEGRQGEARFDAQYWKGNYNPSDQYVLSAPGTRKARLPAGDSGFKNLFLAGDWVKTGFDAGSVEAAIMSGRQASRAITGRPKKVPGE